MDPQEVLWTPHGYKHFASAMVSWPEIVSSTTRGPAKYLPNTDVESLERAVWNMGIPVTNGRPWKVMEFPEVIGASAGRESRWVRVENSGNTIHGHPITQQQLERLTQ